MSEEATAFIGFELPLPLAQAAAALVRRVDADVDAIYAAVIGNRGEEYRDAEADARAYKDAGYSGTVPAGVASWQAAKAGWTAQQACDDILATAAQWHAASDNIRAKRLATKESARTASDSAAVAALRTAWVAYVAAMRSQLGV